MAITNSPRLGIERWSHGTDRHPPRAVWDAQQATLDDLVAIDRQYATLAERPSAGVRGTYCFVESTGILYRDDGEQWRPVVVFGGGAGAAVRTGSAGSEGSSTRAARSDHSHSLPLATGSAHGGMSSSDKAKLDAATGDPVGGSLVSRWSNGESRFAQVQVTGAPTRNDHTTSKSYVDALVGRVHVPVDIPGTANLDSYTSSGVFIQRSTAGATGGTNYPIGQAGLLLVHADGSAWVYQEYRTPRLGSETTRETTFYRSRYSGTWGSWRQSAAVDYVDAGDAATASAAEAALSPIRSAVNAATSAATGSRLVQRDSAGRSRFADPSNVADAATKGYVDTGLATRLEITKAMPSTNVDQVIEPGQYYIISTTGYTNHPVSAAAILEVFLFSTSGQWVIQRWTTWADGSTYTRSSNNGGTTWKDWYAHASTATASASADGLMSRSDKSLLDGATSVQTGSRLVVRDSAGRARFNNPSNDLDAANKRYVDDAARQDVVLFPKSLGTQNIDTLVNAADNGVYRQGASASATTARGYPEGVAGMLEVMHSTNMTWHRYTTFGSNAHVYTRGWYQGDWGPWRRLIDDDEVSTQNTANAIPKRDSNSQINVPSNPTSNWHATSKSYVDAVDSKYASTKSAVDGATNLSTGDALVRRNGDGTFSVSDPTHLNHVVSMRYADSGDASTLGSANAYADGIVSPVKSQVDNATNVQTGSRLVQRDSAGRARFNDPSNVLDAANKRYVDAVDSRLSGRLNPLTYESGLRQMDIRSIGIGSAQGIFTLSRVGNEVELTAQGFVPAGSVAIVDWKDDLSALTSSRVLPVGFRPNGREVHGPASRGGLIRVLPDGSVYMAQASRTVSYGTVRFTTTDAPPSSFTWGDPV